MRNLILLLLTLIWAAPAHALLIDNFNTGDMSGFYPPFGPHVGSANGAGILGGQRNWEIFNPAGGVSVDVAGGLMTLSGGGLGNISWDGEDNTHSFNTASGLGGIDVAQGGGDTIFVDVDSIVGNMSVEFQLYDSTGGLSSRSQNLSVGQNAFALANFTGTANLADVTVMNFRFTFSGSGTVVVDSVSTNGEIVPAPLPIALGLLALAGICLRRRGDSA